MQIKFLHTVLLGAALTSSFGCFSAQAGEEKIEIDVQSTSDTASENFVIEEFQDHVKTYHKGEKELKNKLSEKDKKTLPLKIS